MLPIPGRPLRSGSAQVDGVSPSQRIAKDPRVERVLEAIRSHLEEHLTVGGMAASVGLSRSRLEHLLREQTGFKFTDVIHGLRLEKAITLLGDPRLRIKEVASLCGYATTEGFDKAFRKRFGDRPSAYRRSTFGQQIAHSDSGTALTPR